MIVAIDETGDFSPTSKDRHFHVACHIRTTPTHGETKQHQYRRWETSIPKRNRSKSGEVKGSLLGPEEFESFVDEVILASPPVRMTLVEMRPADNSPERIRQHQEYSVASSNDSVLICSKKGNKRGADHYRLVGDWMRALNTHQYLKLVALSDCVAHSAADVVGHAISGGYDLELADLEYKIDRDFVRPGSSTTAWAEILHETCRKVPRGDDSIPLLDTWTDDHPFMKKYGGMKKFNIGPLFLRHTHFLSSNLHWELRVADIAASLIQRAHNRRESVGTYNRMFPCLAKGGKWTRVVLGSWNAEEARRRPFEK